MTNFVAQVAVTVAVTCVVTWLVPRRSRSWLAGFFVMAAIVDPRPHLLSWLWIGAIFAPMVWAWTMQQRLKQMEVTQ